MRPILFSLGPMEISSLGFFLFLAFLTATFIIWKKTKEKLYSEEVVFDSIFLVTIAGLVGARLSYILFHWQDFGFNLLKWLLINGYPGFYFYGGLASGLASLYWFYKREGKINFWEMFDNFSLGFLAAFLVSEVGVLLDGGEVGKLTSLPWAVNLASEEELRHPLALYKALVFLAFFLIVKKYEVRLFSLKGRFGFLFLFIFGLLNFLLDFLKEFSVYYYWGLGLEQWVSSLLILASGILLYRQGGHDLGKDLRGVMSKLKVQSYRLKRKAKKL